MKITEEFDKQSNKIGTFVILLITSGLAFVAPLIVAECTDEAA